MQGTWIHRFLWCNQVSSSLMLRLLKNCIEFIVFIVELSWSNKSLNYHDPRSNTLSVRVVIRGDSEQDWVESESVLSRNQWQILWYSSISNNHTSAIVMWCTCHCNYLFILIHGWTICVQTSAILSAPAHTCICQATRRRTVTNGVFFRWGV